MKFPTDQYRKQQFLIQNPSLFFLDPTQISQTQTFLKKLRWIEAHESIIWIRKAGEGNMNCTVRVQTSTKSLILKQARPWVEKYPSIDAPWERIEVENYFYTRIKQHPGLCALMPTLLGFDPDSHLLALEDLGPTQDMTCVYSNPKQLTLYRDQLIGYLARLHQITKEQIPAPAPDPSVIDECKSVDLKLQTNENMRRLNYEHIFRIPLSDQNGIDLDGINPGLQQIANQLKQQQKFTQKIQNLGQTYLQSRTGSLLHGDFFPGSWLMHQRQIRIIDPEFSFIGPPEYDLGVMMAHFMLANAEAEISNLLESYSQLSVNHTTDNALAFGFCGAEIMRRLIGVAQLPLALDLNQKSNLLDTAKNLVIEPLSWRQWC